MSQSGWSDERITSLKSLWLEGHSAAQIAKSLGGVTRNAVIGKVHRLGLSGRGAALPHPRTARAPRVTRAHAAANQRRPRSRPSIVAALVAPEAPGTIATMTMLGAHNCRWPIGDPKAEDFSFCGRLASGPYCPAHKARAVQPGTARRMDRDPMVRRALAGLL